MIRTGLVLCLLLSGLTSSCDRFATSPQHKPSARRPPSGAATKPSATHESPPVVPSSDHYALPFAWEKGNDEPLAYARSFVSEVLRDNQNYAQGFKPSSDGSTKPLAPQTPRATVVACADARVLIESWDATPDNDDFVIRNLGNQVSTSIGSVHYGVEQLRTPVLLILGHTGCAAIAAALQGTGGLSEPIRKELEGLHVGSQPSKPPSDAVSNEAVISNVHRQVRLALDRFGPRIVTGRLTVIGAVVDLHGTLEKGAGRVTIVDVNGNSEPQRLRAFVAAVEQSQAEAKADAADAGMEGTEQAEVDNDALLDPIARDLRAAFSALAEKAQKHTTQPKNK